MDDVVWFGVAVVAPLCGFCLGLLFGWAINDG